MTDTKHTALQEHYAKALYDNDFGPGAFDNYRAHCAHDCIQWPPHSVRKYLYYAGVFLDAAPPAVNRDPAIDDAVNAIKQFTEAFDAGQVQLSSPEISGGADIPPHPWHEEWLRYARAALAKVGSAQHG